MCELQMELVQMNSHTLAVQKSEGVLLEGTEILPSRTFENCVLKYSPLSLTLPSNL